MSTTTVTTPNELEIRVERIFDAPRAHVFSVWTDPQLIPEWWGDGTVVEEMDVRPGGRYRFRTAFGVVEGEVREVDAPERLAQTFQKHLQTLEFDDLGDRTKLTQTMRFATTEERDTTMQYGVEGRGERRLRARRRAAAPAHGDAMRTATRTKIGPEKEGTMSAKKVTQKSAKGTNKKEGFTAEEKAAMKARARELKDKADGESAVRASIAAMSPQDRAIAERLHELVKAAAPDLSPKTWYGMPAYAKDGKVVCFFRDAGKFKERYAMFGFNDKAKLDKGSMWPVAFALTKLTAADEARIRALVKKAVS